MQLLFVHAQIEYLESAIEGLNELTHLFNKSDPYLDKKIIQYLDFNIEKLKAQQHKELVNTFESVKATMLLAMQGTDPFNLEKIKIGKNGMIKGVCYKVLQQLQNIIFPELSKNNSKIEQASELMKQLLLGAIQKGRLDIQSLELPISTQKVETIWAELQNDDILKMFIYNIKLIIQHQDALLLLVSKLNMLKS